MFKIQTITLAIITSLLCSYGFVTAQPECDALTEDVTFTNGEVTLAGTLTMPSTEGSFGAVITISGSGPQDRDGAMKVIPGYRPFVLLADHLVANGFAVLRYDDRGVGQSTGDYISSIEEDFFGDAEAAVSFLSERKNIDAERIGLLGQSEGSLIAATVASKDKRVAFVISLGGGAIAGYDLLLSQAERQARAGGMSDEETAIVISEQRRIFDLVIAEKWEELTEVVTATTRKRLQALPEQQRAALGDLDAFSKKRAAQSISTFQHPRYQFLLNHDFGEDWKKVSVPILVLFGELDVQVDAELNKTALTEIMNHTGNKNVTIVEIPEANHLFIKAKTGSMTEYATLPKDFAPGVLDTISDWMRDVVGKK